jgi:hypothetical protein
MLHRGEGVKATRASKVAKVIDGQSSHLLLSSTQSGLMTTMSNLRGKKKL